MHKKNTSKDCDSRDNNNNKKKKKKKKNNKNNNNLTIKHCNKIEKFKTILFKSFKCDYYQVKNE